MCVCVCVFADVNFDALAQASDIRIERRQVVFFCWMQDSNLGSLRHLIASRLNAHSQTDWAIEDQAKKLELNSPSLWWVSIHPTWLHWSRGLTAFRHDVTAFIMRHQMESLFVLLSLCVGNPQVTGGFPAQRDNDTDLWYFCVVSLDKLLNKP